LDIVKELNDPMSNIAVKAHLFKIFRVSLEVHKDLRSTLGMSHGPEDWEKVLSMMEERIEKELNESPELENDIVPWYRCQPYLRPERAVSLEKENARSKFREVKLETDVSA
jgi:hypothetical protein